MLNTVAGTFAYFWAAYASLALGIVALICARAGTPLGQRLLAAAPAPVAALLFVASTFTDSAYWSIGRVPLYAVAQLLPLGLFAAARGRCIAPRGLRLALGVLSLFCWAWQAFWGYVYLYAA
jgi:hypothetical protein